MIPAQTLAFTRVLRKFGTVFATGSPLFGRGAIKNSKKSLPWDGWFGFFVDRVNSYGPLIRKPFYQIFTVQNSKCLSIRCEQSTKEGNGLDIWTGRLAMVGFTAAISIEIATGKGLLENVGLVTPLPIAALAVTSLVGVLLAVFIFQSASNN